MNENLENRVIEWANERGIFEHSSPLSQAYKTEEEVAELLHAACNENLEDYKDAVGDILVTLIIGCKMNGTNLKDCLSQAYNEIKHRKGKMIDGLFVKE